ncbi:hypothetical protein K490DRAFT_54023 [Saccharata proteae CBS 121410]|uniref:Uncharacterized protein n=1 Tax=Saccharata proteae CBS 121410 TaxID=1314787 RepID=A0A9P4LZI4_9PEZI|nr:hypothetical protein K490DRAFT_54023 [Saccharata proteae CBS 121410]
MSAIRPGVVPHPVLLPRPFPTPSIYTLGSLLSTPSSSSPASTLPGDTLLTPRDHDDTHMMAYYKDVALIAQHKNTFLASLGGELLVEPPRAGTALVSIEAERCFTRTLKRPWDAFRRVVESVEGRAWLVGQAARRGGSAVVCFVQAVMEVENARYRRCGARDAGNGLVEVCPAQSATPMMAVSPLAVGKRPEMRSRRDSGFDEPTFTKRDVVGVEIREVLVRVEMPDRPHEIGDLDYRWTYVKMGEEQLAVGLGRALGQEEVLGFWDEEDEGEEDEEMEETEEEEESSADEL